MNAHHASMGYANNNTSTLVSPIDNPFAYLHGKFTFIDTQKHKYMLLILSPNKSPTTTRNVFLESTMESTS